MQRRGECSVSVGAVVGLYGGVVSFVSVEVQMSELTESVTVPSTVQITVPRSREDLPSNSEDYSFTPSIWLWETKYKYDKKRVNKYHAIAIIIRRYFVAMIMLQNQIFKSYH